MSGAEVEVGYVDLAAQYVDDRQALLDAVGRVFDSGWFIGGSEVERLEGRLAALVGAPHVIGVNSGTDALVLALRALGIGAGHEVITVSHSFVATATAISLVGATPVFVDIDVDTMQMDPSELASAISPQTRAVMPVHLNGQPAPRAEIERFCLEHELRLVEDCAQAIGVASGGTRVGSNHVGCFSLHPLKVLSAAGDAGFISVGDAALAERLRRMRNLGLADRDNCVEVAPNSRLDALHAAILNVKLERHEASVGQRRAHADAYRRALAGLVILPPEDGAGDHSIYSAFVVRHPQRDALRQALQRRGIDAKVHYPKAIHQQPVYAGGEGVVAAPHRCVGALPNTCRVVGEILSLPVSAQLTVEQRDQVIAAMHEAVAEVEATVPREAAGE